MGNSESAFRNKYKVHAMSVEITAKEIAERERAQAVESEDTILRRELQGKAIKPLVEQGLDELEIVAILETEERYAKFRPFFHSYVQNQINKARNSQNEKELD